jgi:two-component system, cell cycle response regulator
VRILIADDDALSKRLLEKVLACAGYEVTTVADGLHAVECLSQPDGPRLALLDWMMPELDGPGVCREIRKLREQSYVYMILLTSRESKEDIVAGLESGADDYLVKPFDAEELKARLRTGERILHLEDRLVEAREQMRFKATHDPLTSLWNRGVIMDLLGRELTRSQREHGCTAVLLGDLDHFKSVNDTHGHLVGDQVLREAARRLLLSVRSYDFVGRYGGEEFLIVLNNCRPGSAMARAEEIRKIICTRPVQTDAGLLGITMSLGVLLSSDWGRRPADELLREVDGALYAAKNAGRNRVMQAKPAEPRQRVPAPQPAAERVR